MLRYAGTIFLSAFLLFQVQPMIGRIILPWFGGTPAVWATCILFFQAMLLFGYCYAHLLNTLPIRAQTIVHLVLLAASLAFCRILPSDAWKPSGVESPVPAILLLLLANVGPPYFLISATGPLLQAWFSRSFPETSPYRLYSLSNVGSLLALVSYPVFFEQFFTVHMQTNLWSGGYVAFTALCGWCALKLYREASTQSSATSLGLALDDESADPAASWGVLDKPRSVAEQRPMRGLDVFFWIAFSACGSLLLLATTNQMCQDVAVVPFLYTLPLALYLFSFILCFDNPVWYARPWWGAVAIVTLYPTMSLLEQGVKANIAYQVGVYCLMMFAGCMICHGEIVRLKPAPRRLTAFYLCVALGGVIGGLFVSVVAPYIFSGFWEYPIALVAMATLFALSLFRDGGPSVGRLHWIGFAIVVVAWQYLVLSAWSFIKKDETDFVFRKRNFFGVLEVTLYRKDKEDEYLLLSHGRIEHGRQYQSPSRRMWKTSYYGEESGVGLAINHHPRNFTVQKEKQRNLRIGAIGLGTGTIATYGERGDFIRFYDINAMVDEISQSIFTHRADSAATVDVVLGDARISLERQLKRGEKQDFDVIVVDAFSSDAIPVHLLTEECVQIYLAQLRDPDAGILAIHISNRYINLAPVVRKLAENLKYEAVKINNDSDKRIGVYDSTWILLTRNKDFLADKYVIARETAWNDLDAPLVRGWTDDYCNLLPLVKGKQIRDDFRKATISLRSHARYWLHFVRLDGLVPGEPEEAQKDVWDDEDE